MDLDMLSHDNYTIAWICAVESELTAAVGMLDVEHAGLESADNDTNIYTLGRVGKHNIVIACLPAGIIGANSAATVAINLLRTFSKIRFGLMVGIGGGAPGSPDIEHPENNIHLGDVVVSVPGDSSGGVIQYDLGKSMENGKFVTTGHLNNPPTIVLNAVEKIRSNISLRGQDFIHKHYAEMLERFPRSKQKYTYPGNDADRLFLSDYPHDGGASCAECDTSQTVDRPARAALDRPTIHYGLIGSANRLILSSVKRDELRESKGIICFEMEASGLMNDFPCLVIRGISDYSDGHKNGMWQPYAAAMAAAYAKALINIIQPVAVDKQKLAKDVMQTIDEITVTTKAMLRTIEQIDEHLFYGRLPQANGAFHDAAAEGDEIDQQCLPGTRVELLEQIRAWAVSPLSKGMFWLNGAAGTGKSTISRTVAAEFSGENKLGASFFFKRGEGDRGNAQRLFTTMAIQLARVIPGMQSALKRAIDEDPSIGEKGPRQQFEQLIFRALKSIETKAEQTLLLLVIDALDECDRDDHMRLMVDLFAKLQTISSFTIRIFLTSRPELPLRLGFMNLTSDEYDSFVLQEISPVIVKRDFSTYLDHRFSQIVKDNRSLPKSWPGESSVELLVEMAYPLFIFAATIYRFIADPVYSPAEQLDYLFDNKHAKLKPINRIYEPILSRLLPDDSGRIDHAIDQFRAIVGPITVLAEPLSRSTLSALLDIREDLIESKLQLLHAVLDVPGDRTGVIRPYHLSFIDYLHGEDQTLGYSRFRIDARAMHAQLSQRCLSLLSTTTQLRTNISEYHQLGTSWTSASQTHVKSALSPEIQYACRYWAQHLLECGSLLPGTISLILELLKHRFLYWIEALSLLGRLGDAIMMLRSLSQMLGTLIQESRDLHSLRLLTHDAFRFLLSNRATIHDYPMQLYASALIFAPQNSLIKARFLSEIPYSFAGLPGTSRNWSNLLYSFEGSLSRIQALAISDTGLLAAGNLTGCLKIWSIATGEEQYSIDVGVEIDQVTFSSDGSLLAVGTRDAKARVWDCISGTLRRTIEIRADPLTRASLPSLRLLSKSLGVWHREPGNPKEQVTAHPQVPARSSRETIVVLESSPNDTIEGIDGIVEVLIYRFLELKHMLEYATSEGEHLAYGIMFSRYTHPLASGAFRFGGTIKMWDIADGSTPHTFNVRTTSFAFFPRNEMLASSTSTESEIKLSDLLEGSVQSSLVNSSPLNGVITYSPADLLASAIEDSVRLCDVDPNIQGQDNPSSTKEKISHMIFDPTGDLLCVVVQDGGIKVLDYISGKEVCHIEKEKLGRPRASQETPVEFSPDGLMLACCWETITLWNPRSSAFLSPLPYDGSYIGSTDSGQNVCFSSCNGYIALPTAYCIHMLDTFSEQMLWTCVRSLGMRSVMRFVADNSYLAICQLLRVELLSTKTGSLDRVIAFEDGPSSSLHKEARFRRQIIRFSPDGEFMFTVLFVDIPSRTPFSSAIKHKWRADMWRMKPLSSDESSHQAELQESIYGGTGLRRSRFQGDLRQLDTSDGSLYFNTPMKGGSSVYGISQNGYTYNDGWIHHGHEQILLLPKDLQGSCRNNHGNVFAFASVSHGLVFLELAETGDGKIEYVTNSEAELPS